MKKLIITLATVLTTQLAFAIGEETNQVAKVKKIDQSDGYFSFGGGFPAIITFNLGKRVQHNHHGWDAGVGVTPLIIAIEGHAYANYLYYPNPNLDSQIYMGLGSQIGYGTFIHYWGKGIGYIKPQLVFGKEFTTSRDEKRFIQASFGVAHFSTKGATIAPSLTVTYGLKF